MAVLKKLGWDRDLTPEELAVIERVGGDSIDKVSWSTDLSGGIQRVVLSHGCHPYGNGKARAKAWNLPDQIPVHREPIGRASCRERVCQYGSISGGAVELKKK